MSLKLDFWVNIYKVEKDGSKFLLAFSTSQVSSSSTAKGGVVDAIDNEVAFGGVLAKIKANKFFTIGVPPKTPNTVHRFHLTPTNQAILDLSLDFTRHLQRQETKGDVEVNPSTGIPVFKPRQETTVCEQKIAGIKLHKVMLLSFVATAANDTYAANLKVTGNTEVEYEPAEDCQKWLKL